MIPLRKVFKLMLIGSPPKPIRAQHQFENETLFQVHPFLHEKGMTSLLNKLADADWLLPLMINWPPKCSRKQAKTMQENDAFFNDKIRTFFQNSYFSSKISDFFGFFFGLNLLLG